MERMLSVLSMMVRIWSTVKFGMADKHQQSTAGTFRGASHSTYGLENCGTRTAWPLSEHTEIEDQHGQGPLDFPLNKLQE